MPRPPAISGRIVVLVMAAIAAIPALMLFPSPRMIADGQASIELHAPGDLESRIVEIRYWKFGTIPSVLDPDEVREGASIAEHSEGIFTCYLPTSYEEHGWIFIKRVDTLPFAKQITIWIHFADDSWTTQTLPVPAQGAEGNREITMRIDR